MRPSGDDDTLDAGDSELGPGVDLTISLLAMVLLVLVMVARQRDDLQRRVHDQDAPGVVIADLRAQAERDRSTLAKAKAELLAAAERDAAIRDLRAELQAVRGQIAGAGRQTAETDRQAADLNRRLAAAMQQSAQSEAQRAQQATALGARIAELERQLAARANGNTPVIRLEVSKSAMFGMDDATLTAEARAELSRGLPLLAKAARDRGANQIVVVGTSSPETRPGNRNVARSPDATDSNIDLSATRALAVAHFLVAQGVPYRCIVATGQGLTRTSLPPGESAAPPGSGLRYAAERRVDVLVEADPQSTCSTDMMLRSVRMTPDQGTAMLGGKIDGVTANGWPIIGGMEMQLYGITPLLPNKRAAFAKAFLGTAVRCAKAQDARYMCQTYTDIDLAETALENRAADPLPNAPLAYVTAWHKGTRNQ